MERADAVARLSHCELPYLRADWFVSRAALPPLYHDILRLPNSAGDLEAMLGVDVQADIDHRTARRAGFQDSGVSDNNRVVERHATKWGAYWRSYDFSSSTDDQDISLHPLDFHEAGGELIFSLPNGLQAYMLVNGRGQRIDTGPPNIVNNARDPNRERGDSVLVKNGLTCMSCHTKGMQPFTDTIRPNLLKLSRNDVPYDYAKALALYADKPEMDASLQKDSQRFAAAVRATGAEISSKEPVVALERRYDRSLSLESAAAEAGFTAGDFKTALQFNPELATLLGTLKTTGSIKRDTWENAFGQMVGILHLGTYLPTSELPALVVAARPVPPPFLRGPQEAGRLWINPMDGAEMVWVPPGPFPMGDDDDAIREDATRTRSNPRHTVTLSGYYIYKNLVTVGMYRRFCRATGRMMPPAPTWGWREEHPVVNVSWWDAKAYCEWAGATLPTEAQWEKAARGTDARRYPWGDDWDPARLQHSALRGSDARGTTAVGSFAAGTSPYGALDMAGNTWEWCEDWYDPEYWNRFVAGGAVVIPNPVNEEKPAVQPRRVIRGGSWTNVPQQIFRSAYRGRSGPDSKFYNGGFRCVWTPD